MTEIYSGFEVGIKGGFATVVRIRSGFATVVGIRSGFEVGIGGGFEVGRFLSFPFLNWWCLVVQKRTEN